MATPIAPDVLRGLTEASGELVEHASIVVDDVAFGASLRPADGESLGRTLELLSAARVPVVIRGNASRLALGNTPREAGILLDVSRLAGVIDFDPGEGVCQVRAGTPLAVVRSELSGSIWELPLDAPGDASTVGGVVAAGAAGPRAQGYGAPRDVVLGLDVVLASGVRTRCGGRVVKNVTGYDLCKLYTGSLGSLGVIEALWLRLRPRPAAVRTLEWQGVGSVQGLAGAREAARSPAARATSLYCKAPAAGEAFRLLVELAGDAPVVEREAERIGNDLGAVEAPGDAFDVVRRNQAGRPGEVGLRFRVSSLPSKLEPVASRLRDAGAVLQVQPGRSVVYAFFDGTDPAGAFEASAGAAQLGEGSALLEEAPASAKRGRDVFGAQRAEVAIARALKERFDPHGILNPGRFAGCL